MDMGCLDQTASLGLPHASTRGAPHRLVIQPCSKRVVLWRQGVWWRADEHAPPAVKSIWIAVFLMAIPVGYALGYVYGGLLGPLLGWRLAFLSEASLMLPFVAFAFLTTPIPFSHGAPRAARSAPDSETAGLLDREEPPAEARSTNGAQHTDGELSTSGREAPFSPRLSRRKVWAALQPLARDVGNVLGCGFPPARHTRKLCCVSRTTTHTMLRAAWQACDTHVVGHQPLTGMLDSAPTAHRRPRRSRTYTFCILGNTAQTALLGMFAYWGPKATTFMFHLPPGHADILFGAVTVLAGIAGTLAGGLLLDALGGSEPGAALVCLTSTIAGYVLLQAAFRLCFSLAPFVVVFAVGQFALFMLQSPVTRVILLSVAPELRPLAFGIQTIAIHVFGDVPSPPLAGWLHDTAFSADDVVRRHPGRRALRRVVAAGRSGNAVVPCRRTRRAGGTRRSRSTVC